MWSDMDRQTLPQTISIVNIHRRERLELVLKDLRLDLRLLQDFWPGLPLKVLKTFKDIVYIKPSSASKLGERS